MRILNFGSCNVDYVYTVDHIVRGGETISSQKMEIFPGGKGLNQSIATARAGANVYHAGFIGEDGEFLKQQLENSNVDVTYLKKADIKNGHAIIQVDSKGENSIFLFKGSNGIVTNDYIDEVLNDFGQGDILILQNEINNISYIIEKAYQRGMQILFNPAPFDESVKEINLNLISYLVVNEVEAAELAGGRTDPHEIAAWILNRYPDIKTVLTLGRKGCVYFDNESFIAQPSFCVDAVDTTAAGDTFIGYFVALISQGKSYEDAIKTASAASAIAVSREGASTSIPEAHEVESALKNLKPNTEKTKSEKEIQREKILKYITENLKDASLSGLSSMLGYSKAYTCKLVLELTEVSFTTLIQRERCRRAAELLKSTQMPISEIVSEMGYNNETFFRKKFCENYGINPHKYRKNGGN